MCSCFEPKLLDSFLKELFRCASLRALSMYHPSAETHQITYRHVWEELISSGAVPEYKPLAGMNPCSNPTSLTLNCRTDSVRRTLVNNFLSGGTEEESKAGRRNDREQLALSGLYKVPFDAVKAHERNLIFQHASSRILGGELAVYCTSYLTFLVYCMPYIKKSTDLVCRQLKTSFQQSNSY